LTPTATSAIDLCDARAELCATSVVASNVTNCTQLNALIVQLQMCALEPPECSVVCLDSCASNTTAFMEEYNSTVSAYLGSNATCDSPFANCTVLCSVGLNTTVSGNGTMSGNGTTPNNMTCDYVEATEACAAALPPLSNTTGYDATCTSLKQSVSVLNYCVYNSPRFGDCSPSTCMAQLCTNQTDLADINAKLANAAMEMSGLNGTCQYSSCADVCSGNYTQSTGSRVEPSFVAAAMVVVLGTWVLSGV